MRERGRAYAAAAAAVAAAAAAVAETAVATVAADEFHMCMDVCDSDCSIRNVLYVRPLPAPVGHV